MNEGEDDDEDEDKDEERGLRLGARVLCVCRVFSVWCVLCVVSLYLYNRPECRQ